MTMNMIEVSVDHSAICDGDLGEIYQSMNTKQALLLPTGKNAFKRITKFALCRDFLVDSYTYAKAKQNFYIYGFSFNGETEPLEWERALILQQFPTESIKATFLSHLAWIHKIEQTNHFPKTTIYTTANSKELVIEGSKQWLKNCLAFSLYSLLLRVLCYKTKTDEWLTEISKQDSSDGAYVASIARETWNQILGDLSLIDTPTFCGFTPTPHNMHTVHHNSGFVSVFGYHSEMSVASVKKNKHWHLMKTRGFKLYTK
jgi:hypothetical protein